ncbi:MAG: transglycosylase SLT domain-containing protein, partial [Blastocatellia bacterium]
VLGVVATVAKWVTFAVAATVAVLVVAAVVFSAPWAAAALQWLAPLMGKLIFSAAEGGAGVSAGEVAGGLVAAGSVNNFIAKKRGNRRTSRRKIVRQAIGVALSAAEILQLIHDNNQARAYGADDATVFCQTYKESMFKPMARAGSHRGLLEVNPVAAKEAGLGNGQATPAKNPIYFNNIFDPAQNIRTGTSYLAIRIQRAGDDLTRGLEGFGTGSGYADNILDCAALVNGGIAIGSVEPGLGAIMFWVGLRKIYP